MPDRKHAGKQRLRASAPDAFLLEILGVENMKFMGLNELREKYLGFYESKGHLRLPSFSLIPNGDKSLLLINSGMAPMKKYFTGEVEPPRRRVTTCQKCIRTPDIENVGHTARHGTFFEMLGNFSFGDYFKMEAITWAWEFSTQVIGLDPARIYVTIYEEDDEAYRIWTEKTTINPSHIVRKDKSENFWEHGSGPCGPCSELHYDRGEEYGCGRPDCGPGCECDRYVEYWNLVFTQFDNDGNGNYSRLEHPNIDTGMGLERLACIVQNADNIFEVDTVRRILDRVCEMTGKVYGSSAPEDVSLRVITDHIRSATMMIGDGVFVSNEGRGYVLRRLLRRAARHGKLLGMERPFLYELCRTVIEINREAYPNLAEKADMIEKMIRVEEEGFLKTIDAGMQMLADMIADGSISGEKAFMLYDTYGFPFDLTREILEEKGIEIDEDGFTRKMEEQKLRARSARKDLDKEAWKNNASAIAEFGKTEFTGYEQMEEESEVAALYRDGSSVDRIEQGQSCDLILKSTPFYAESGGQAADAGVITSGEEVFRVTSVSKTPSGTFLHHGTVERGAFAVGQRVNAQIDRERRLATRRNHTGAHLLQAALRRLLGTHVEQAGQLVNAEELRFDFTHYEALTADELRELEDTINAVILQAVPVMSREMPIEEAKKLGAMALFGEKYREVVRVVSVGDFSIELCGGTHVQNTGEIGLFKITSETSVASGVRRITGVTGTGALAYVRENLTLMQECAAALKASNIKELAVRAGQVMAEERENRRRIDSLTAELSAMKAASVLANARRVCGLELVAGAVEGASADELRAMVDEARAKSGKIVAVFAGINREKGTVSFAACCGAEAVQMGAHAGRLVKEIAAVAGGSGGGRPDSAMAGGKDVTKVSEALEAAEGILKSMIEEK